MTLVPAVLVLIVGSELIRTSIERWFNAPMDEILSSANQIASDYYHERQMLVERSREPHRARARRRSIWRTPDVRPIRDLLAPDVTLQRVQMVEVYRVGAGERVAARRSSRSSTSPRRRCRPATAARRPIGWRRRRSAGSAETRSIEALGSVRRPAARGRRDPVAGDGRPTGVVVATDYLTGDLAARSRRMTQAFENYNQLRVLKRPLTGVYLSFFLMVTLLILVGATWMGLYLAKRITRPVQMLAAAAREIGAGRLDQRVEPQSNDEFGSLVEAFNAMAGELATQPPQGRPIDRSSSSASTSRSKAGAATSRRFSSASRPASSRSTPPATITTINSAAARLLSLDRHDRRPAGAAVFDRAGSAAARARCWPAPGRGKAEPAAQEIALARDGQELHLAVVATALVGDSGVARGRGAGARRRDAADSRAEGGRVARGGAAAGARDQESADADSAVAPSGCGGISPARRRRRKALVDECTTTIVGEVESLKGLVDEFSQFARMPSPRTVPTDLGAAHHRHARALQRHLHRRAHRAAVRAGRAARAARRRADPPRHHQPGRQRDRGDGAPRRRSSSRRSSTRPTASSASSSPTTARAFRRRSARSCSCRTTRPSGAAAASGWRSCAASSPSTAAASTSATTRRAAHALQSSCRAERRLYARARLRAQLERQPEPEPRA